jgi:type I restriction enzyme S subunit
MMRISVDPKEVSTEYLELCLRTPKCRRQVQSYAAGTSSSMLKINGANLRKIEVPFVELDDQISILQSINSFSEMLRDAEDRFNSSRSLQAQLANDAASYRGGSV